MKMFIPTNKIPSATLRACDHAENFTSKRSPWGLRDILRNHKVKEELSNIRGAFDRKAEIAKGPNTRFTIIKKRKGGFWHASGIGAFEAANFGEVKEIAKQHGYSHCRMGAIKVALNN